MKCEQLLLGFELVSIPIVTPKFWFKVDLGGFTFEAANVLFVKMHLPTLPNEEDITQGQFIVGGGVNKFEFRVFLN